MLTWSRLKAYHLSGAMHQLRAYRGRNKLELMSDEFPKITVPQKMQENLRRQKIRDALMKAQAERPRLKSLVLSSKIKQYNHYKGQKFTEFDTKKLASHGWKHRRCGQDFFTLMPRGSNPSLHSDWERFKSFEEMGLAPEINKYLRENNITRPTKIQSLVIPVMMKGQHILSAAETGSGKTYAYVLPLVHILRHHAKTCDTSQEIPNSPFAIIVAPSRELVNQITNVCSSLSEAVPFKAVKLADGRNSKLELKKQIFMDILITTPGTLDILLASRKLSLSRMNTIVLDEADTLVDDSFIDDTQTILEKLQVGPAVATDEGVSGGGSVQVALVSATYPRNLEENIGHILPVDAFTKLATKQLHCVMPHVQQNFLRMRSMYKYENIVRIMKETGSNAYMVFCNTTETCYWLSKSLHEMDIQSVCLTSFLSPKDRAKLLASFLEGNINVLICTDIASRGLDTHMVDHVINFDFPKFISDYIHRAGRVGRVGSQHKGQVTNFVVHSSDIELVWKIEMAVRQEKELHNVNANIKRALKARAERTEANTDSSDL